MKNIHYEMHTYVSLIINDINRQYIGINRRFNSSINNNIWTGIYLNIRANINTIKTNIHNRITL